ncbi:hypothetical protein SBV1_1400006 [Verrucomicrobia bacterium]|nr:hypothetical protein SBV1_1400006 [Verrucomicrobiota bacterium]
MCQAHTPSRHSRAPCGVWVRPLTPQVSRRTAKPPWQRQSASGANSVCRSRACLSLGLRKNSTTAQAVAWSVLALFVVINVLRGEPLFSQWTVKREKEWTVKREKGLLSPALSSRGGEGGGSATRVRAVWPALLGSLGFRKRQQAARTPNASRGRQASG